MEWLGKLLAAPVRLFNVPLRATEKLVEELNGGEVDRIASAPLEALAQSIEEVFAQNESE